MAVKKKTAKKQEDIENKVELAKPDTEKITESALGVAPNITRQGSLEQDSQENMLKKQEKQTKWVLIIMAGLIAGIFISSWMVSESKKFEYAGFEWQKEMFGKIPIHTTLITGYNINGMPINTKISFRNDPRELETKIPFEGDMRILKGPVYFSMNLNSSINECGTLSLVGFGLFMGSTGFKTITAMASKELSEQYGKEYIDCTNMKDSTVFVFTGGDESKITQDKSNPGCYTVIVKDCEDLEVLERLEAEIISNFKKI